MQPDPIPPPRELADRLRRALERMPEEGSAPAASSHAASLFAETFGAAPAMAAEACAFAPLAAEHTDYFAGFGLLVRQRGGVAVAAQAASGGGRLTVTGADDTLLARLLEAIRARLAHVEGLAGPLDVAISSTVVSGGDDTLLAAAATAFLRATGFGDDPALLARTAAGAVQEVLERPLGPARVLAALADGPLALIDAHTFEHLALDKPASTGFAVVDAVLPRQDYQRLWERAALVERSVERLRQAGFPDASSLRAVEHRDLPLALSRVEPTARPLLRHLISEDRRVPRMVAALKREDSQILGAMMLMSHASRRDELGESSPLADFVATEAEAAEGIYGARPAGASGAQILIVGRPFLLPAFLDRLSAGAQERFDHPVTTHIL
jgi:galactokinase